MLVKDVQSETSSLVSNDLLGQRNSPQFSFFCHFPRHFGCRNTERSAPRKRCWHGNFPRQMRCRTSRRNKKDRNSHRLCRNAHMCALFKQSVNGLSNVERSIEHTETQKRRTKNRQGIDQKKRDAAQRRHPVSGRDRIRTCG